MKVVLSIVVFLWSTYNIYAQDSAISNITTPPSDTLIINADTLATIKDTTTDSNSIVQNQPIVKPIVAASEELQLVEQTSNFHNSNLAFFLLLILIAFPAIFKYVYPVQFSSLFAIFKNPMLSVRNLKEHLNQNGQTSALFYLFYSYSVSLFLYFGFFNSANESGNSISGITILTLFAIISLAFIIKYGFLKLTGWVFGIQEKTEGYLFQTLVFNRILSLAVIPFTVFLALGYARWRTAILVIACILIVALLINRYFKSGSIWGHFMKYGKLHFFLYLCASEIIPMAILVKLITNWQ